MSRILLFLALIGSAGVPTSSAQSVGRISPSAEFPADPSLNDFLQWARQHHPDLAAADARVETIRAQAEEQGALPDLKLAWGEMIVPVETRVGSQRRVLSLSQRFPWFGTLGLTRAAGLAEAEAEQSRFQGRVLSVEQEIRSAWYQLALIQGETRIVADQLGLARQAEASLRAEYESGSGAYAKVLGAQMDLGRLERRWAGLQDHAPAIHSRLLTAAGLDGDHPLPFAALPDSLIKLSDLPNRAGLLRILQEKHPGLTALDHRQDSQRLRLALADKSAYPELMLGLDYIMTDPARMPDVNDSGKDPVVARVAVNLPLWGGKTGARQAAAAGRLRAAVADRHGLRIDLIRQLDENLFRVRDAIRDLDLHEEVLMPRGRQMVAVASADLAASRADYSDLMAIRRNLLELELGRLRAGHDLAQAGNDLAALMNVSPDVLNKIGKEQ